VENVAGSKTAFFMNKPSLKQLVLKRNPNYRSSFRASNILHGTTKTARWIARGTATPVAVPLFLKNEIPSATTTEVY